jgi:N-acetyl-gamma-glutamyl-phosphate reductase
VVVPVATWYAVAIAARGRAGSRIMPTVGIVGASGYMGGEVLRVLLDHPEAELAWATSRQAAPIEDFHPNLYGTGIKLIHPDDAGPCDVVFLALPTAASIEMTVRFLEQGSKVIDLGSAFRLSDRACWERVYGMEHPDWPLADEAVYGISELHAKEIADARLVANPGCFSSAAILGLAPLVREKLVDERHLVIDGISGTAGAGAELARPAHHAEIGNNLVPYNVVDHRHTYEMEQELSLLGSSEATVHFTPTYVPIVRGILDVCHGFPLRGVKRDELLELYRDFYSDSPFVQVYDLPKEPNVSWQYKPYPWVSSVSGTNYCFIGLDVDERRGRIAVFSVLDSIGKGGAQAGIENMNLMFGLDRTAGLSRRGIHPS